MFRHRMPLTLAFSFGLHLFVLFGIALTLPDVRNLAKSLQPLQVVLVNSSSRTAPEHPDALAQHNLDGGGNTKEDRTAKSPFPTMEDGAEFTPEQTTQRVKMLEQEQKRLMAKLKSMHTIPAEKNVKRDATGASGTDLMQRSLEIARLEATISKEHEAYEKLPRRRFIGARTRSYPEAQYVEDWRAKVERVGNLNYPQAARQKHMFGSLQLTVSIRADGSLENVEVSHSAGPGKTLLDAAAMRIVKLAAPFAPLPPDIRRNTDILSITRTWTFTESDKLEGE